MVADRKLLSPATKKHRRVLSILAPTEALAKAVMILVSFIPFFALWEVGRVLGPGKLTELFFRGRPA